MYQQLLKFLREQSHKRQINNLPKHKTKKCNYNEDTVSVICWNIRGIGDKLDQSETLNYLMKNHIIILLETMKSPDYEINIANFTYFNFSTNEKHPKACRFSGGFGILIKKSILKYVKIQQVHECLVWITINSKLFGDSNVDTKIGCVYISPQDSSYNGAKIEAFDMIDEQLSRSIKTHRIIMVGDFNARTGSLKDVIDDRENIPDRYNMDTRINTYGKRLVETCIGSGVFLINGRYYADKQKGSYTYYNRMGKSIVDYLLMSQLSVNLLRDFKIGQLSVDSDHCPLLFSLSCLNFKENIDPVETIRITDKRQFYTYLFDTDNSKCYQDFLCSDICSEFYAEFYDLAAYFADSNMLLNLLHNLMTTVANACFKKISRNRNIIKSTTFPNNAWFDSECKELKRTCNKLAKDNDLTRFSQCKQYHDMCKDYKTLIQRKKRKQVKFYVDKLQNCITKNPNEYWKIWKKMKHKNNTPMLEIYLMEFYDCFLKQSRPPTLQMFDYEFMSSIQESVTNESISINNEDTIVADEILKGKVTKMRFILH